MSEKRAKTADLSALQIERNDDLDEEESSINYKFISIALVIIVVIISTFLIFSSGSTTATNYEFAKVANVFPSVSESILTASGYVVAQRQAAIASKGTGRLEYLSVEEGDEVKKGQLIAQLEHDDVDAAFRQAEAGLSVAKANLVQIEADLNEANLNYGRQKKLLAKGLISQSEFDISEARFKSSRAMVASGKAQIDLAEAFLASAQVNVENTRIRAPFDGTVLTKNADIGEMVAPFAASANSKAAVVTIADMSSLEVEADVSESNIQRISAGLNCEIILDAFPNHRYPAYVHKIVPTANRAKATVLTKIRFKNRDEKVLPEMSAKVNFFSESASDDAEAMQPFKGVPKSALTKHNGRDAVFTIEANKATVKVVQIGREVAGKVEIVNGLELGETVLLNPAKDLRSGAEISLK